MKDLPIFTILLACGHIRTAFTRKPGANFYCTECKAKVWSQGEIQKEKS